MFVRLSHVLERDGPHRPGASACDAKPQSRISEGSAYNTFEIALVNHLPVGMGVDSWPVTMFAEIG
jgi:hypothetical protein